MGLNDLVTAATNKIEPLRLYAAKKAIKFFAEACPPRPMSHSMYADYVTWPGLVERRYSGRHLPPPLENKAPGTPDVDAVAALFQRKTFRPAHDSSLLFPIFAQWFVDGFLRTKWEDPKGPRHFKENESGQEIDLNQLYGGSETQTRMLRDLGNGGRLRSRTVDGEEWPELLFEERLDGFHVRADFARTEEKQGLYSDDNLFRIYNKWPDEDLRHAWATGLEFGCATLGQSLMNVLFLREHNRVAGLLEKTNPDWDDERLFQTARNVMTVLLLNVVMRDYIPHIARTRLDLGVPPGWAEQQPWYRTNRMAVEFALLYRWHDLIPDEFAVGDKIMGAQKLVRPNSWLTSHKLRDVLLGAAKSPAGRIGLHNTASFLNAKGGADVKRLSIEMARTCNLRSYNDYRQHYGLKPIHSFLALTKDREAAAELERLYGSIDKLEWWVGLFAEYHEPPDCMGELLRIMVANDAFTQALTNPLLSKAVYGPQTFGEVGMRIIENTATLADIAERNTGLSHKDAKRVTMKVQKR